MEYKALQGLHLEAAVTPASLTISISIKTRSGSTGYPIIISLYLHIGNTSSYVREEYLHMKETFLYQEVSQTLEQAS